VKRPPCRTSPCCRPRPLAIPERSFVEDMAETVDCLRQLATDFGARPYRVFIVTVQWDGARPGEGKQSVLSEEELLPTPRADLSAISYQITNAGRTDQGTVRLYEVSPNYTEADLHRMIGSELADNQQAFVEIRLDGREGNTPVRHRLTVSGAPFYDATGFQWILPLKIQYENRTKRGELSERVATSTANPLL
jgi:hypothetical protein